MDFMLIDLKIPQDAKCLLKLGQEVDLDTPCYETGQQEEVDIFIAKELGIPPNKIFQYLKKLVGDPIRKNDLLATKKNFLTSNKFFSPVDGVIKEIDHNEGKLVVTAAGTDKLTVRTKIKGTVSKIDKYRVGIEIKKASSFALKKTDAVFGGRIVLVRQENDPNLTLEEVAKKIAVIKSPNAYLQRKIEALQTTGFVTLMQITEKTDFPSCQIKNPQDMDKIFEDKFTYCFVDADSGRIIFYH